MTSRRIGQASSPRASSRRARGVGSPCFLTGRRDAGENLARILAERTTDLGPPIQMCDALSRNLPKPFAVMLGHCLAHARRHVVEGASSFPAECRRILETLGTVYRHDADAREQGLSPEARLAHHQTHSGPCWGGSA